MLSLRHLRALGIAYLVAVVTLGLASGINSDTVSASLKDEHANMLDMAFNQVLESSTWWRESAKLAQLDSILPQVTYLTMRDGTRLFTVYWSIDSTPRPTVFIRSPYGPLATQNVAVAYLPFGFNVVMQNMRATGLSEGTWTFFDGCWFDGNDTLAWIASQPWSNGEVFQAGASADGFLTYFDMKIAQPHMKGQFLIYSSGYPYIACYENGGFHENLATYWLDIMHAWRPFSPSYLETPLLNEGFDEWWVLRTMNSTDYERINFPAVHVAGWYDIFTGPMITTFNNYQYHAGPNARGKQKFVIGPRGHCAVILGSWNYYFPGGMKDLLWAFELSVDLFRNLSTYKWSDDEIGMQTKLAEAPNLKTYTFYIMGPSQLLSSAIEKREAESSVGMYWTTLDEWPTPKMVNFYLTDANGLSSNPPLATYVKSYIYDPNNPVPTYGGNNLFTSCGPYDQQSVEKRSDVLLFTTEPFTTPVAVVGSIQVFLYVSSNCTDTDFTVKITDVYPSGSSVLISDTILRMRWRDSISNFTLMQPGVIYPINITLWQTAQIFDRGHSLRLAISSSNYPRFSPNFNNGLLVHEGGPKLLANNNIHLGKGYPSRILLPVVAMSQIPPNVPA